MTITTIIIATIATTTPSYYYYFYYVFYFYRHPTFWESKINSTTTKTNTNTNTITTSTTITIATTTTTTEIYTMANFYMLVQGTIRNGLNNFLNETISSAKDENPCKEHSTDVYGYVYWQNTSFVQLFDKSDTIHTYIHTYTYWQ